jgi:type II restriction enzyme
MTDTRPYLQHLSGSGDLETPHEETRAGFLSLALEKNRQAIPFVEEARALKVTASQAKTPAELLQIEGIEPALLTAASLSNKAMGHLRPEDKRNILREWIKEVLEPEGSDFVDELVYRFLLTRGDALGGMMRNLAGVLGERKFTRAILSALRLRKTPYHWYSSKSRTWIRFTDNDADIESQLKGLSWTHNSQKRTIIYNRKIKIVDKNIDISILSCSHREIKAVYDKAESYLALGEIKGGIDPAGADEHWKTANSALGRIRDKFFKLGFSPKIFFVGAAIEKAMAQEIWRQLENGQLTNAANLTNADQVASLCHWLVNL